MSALTKGIHHLGFTVPNITVTAGFFESVLGFKRIGGNDDYPSIFISDGTVMLTLWQAQTHAPTPFDRKCNVGLHHFALKIETPDQLHELVPKLKEAGAELEFEPEPLGKSDHLHLMCTIPGGLRMELFS